MSFQACEGSPCAQCKAGNATEQLSYLVSVKKTVTTRRDGGFHISTKTVQRKRWAWFCQNCAYWMLKTNPSAERIPSP